MNGRRLLYLVVAVVVVAIVGVAYIVLSGGSGEASEPISAPTLSLAEATATGVPAAATPSPAMTEEMTEEPTEEATEEMADPTAEPTAEPAAASDAARTLFRIVPDESEVSFTLEEDLMGQHTVVVGTTDQVAGDLIIDLADPAASEVGTIRINVRTLSTDNDFRNRAIRGQILQSSQAQFEYAEFRPTALTGLPDSVAVGDTLSFQIEGELQVRDISQPTTWDAEVTLVSADRLEGTATTVVTRAEYNLEIPSVQSVANVTDEVTLAINFIATQVTE